MAGLEGVHCTNQCLLVLTEGERLEELTPYTAEDLALLYPNPQLDANHIFIESFVQVGTALLPWVVAGLEGVHCTDLDTLTGPKGGRIRGSPLH